MSTYKTKPLCKYPDCKSVSQKTWSLAPLCADHHTAVRDESLLYYAKRIQQHERVHYIKIEPAVREALAAYTRWLKGAREVMGR